MQTSKSVARGVRQVLLYVVCLSLPVASGITLEVLHHTVRTTAAMLFLLEVLAVATFGKAPLAILTSLTAALTFSYDFCPRQVALP